MIFTLQHTSLEKIQSKGKCFYQFSEQDKLVFMAEKYPAMIGTIDEVTTVQGRTSWFKKSFKKSFSLIMEYNIQLTTIEAGVNDSNAKF